MIDELRLAIEHARQHPEEAQRDLAVVIEEWLDEQEWDAIISSPRGQETLRKIIAEAHEAIARGDIEEGGFGE